MLMVDPFLSIFLESIFEQKDSLDFSFFEVPSTIEYAWNNIFDFFISNLIKNLVKQNSWHERNSSNTNS